MSELVRSLGGPILIMDTATWERWGGSSSNSTTGFAGSDYDFACLSNGYIAKSVISGGEMLILNDMPMDTGIVDDQLPGLSVIRIMNGDLDDLEKFWSNARDRVFDEKNEIEDETVEEFVVATGDMVLVEASAKEASFRRGDCLGFGLPTGPYVIKTYDYSDETVRVIVHRLSPS